MKEVEILFKLNNSKKRTLEILKKFSFLGVKKTKDIYFYDPLRDSLKPQKRGRLKSAFRLRDKGGEFSIAYKIDHFKKDEWIYSDEYETRIENNEVFLEIVKNLGFQELIVVDSKKYIFTNSEYEIVFEEVKNLGFFLEVEKLQEVEDNKIAKEKESIRSFVCNLGLETGEELNKGKPELMLAKKNK